MPRAPLDMSHLTPEKLREASQGLFTRITDADLKRDHRRRGGSVPEWVTEALRTEHLDRWQVTLERMLAQVDGRLRVLEAEWEANRAKVTPQDLAALDEEYLSSRLRSERFRSGVVEALSEANVMFDGRVAVLEHAIQMHREGVLADDSVEPSKTDLELWAVIDD